MEETTAGVVRGDGGEGEIDVDEGGSIGSEEAGPGSAANVAETRCERARRLRHGVARLIDCVRCKQAENERASGKSTVMIDS